MDRLHLPRMNEGIFFASFYGMFIVIIAAVVTGATVALYFALGSVLKKKGVKFADSNRSVGFALFIGAGLSALILSKTALLNVFWEMLKGSFSW